VNPFVIEDFSVLDENDCNIYMVRFDDTEYSEVDKFYNRYFEDEGNEYYDDAEAIFAIIEHVSIHGASAIRRNRAESKAFALPPKSMDNSFDVILSENNLRLYYVQVTPNIIVLLGGGIAHGSPSGNPPIQLQDAQIFAKKIIESKNICYAIEERKLVSIGREAEINIY
jgi:hypothetical protein